MVVLAQVVEHRLFDIAKSVFALLLKILPNGTAQSRLDDLVRIDKRHAQAPRELTSDGAFARAGQANEGDVQDRLT